MKNALPLLFAALFLCGCSVGNRYSGHGITFTYPEGWAVSHEDDLDDGEFFISVDDASGNTAGMIMITCYPAPEGCDCEEEARDFLRTNTIALSENEDYKDLNVEDIPGANLNGYPAYGVSYRYRWFGSLNYGETYTFCHGIRIISITLTETLINTTTRDDKSFRLFKKSFRIQNTF